MLLKSPDIEVVGTATNGREALDLVPKVKADVICTDLHMPVMNGLEFTREVMATHPTPILLVSVTAYESSLSAFEVLQAGAVDIFLKPRASFEIDYEQHAAQLIQKIKILSGVRVFRRPRSLAAMTVKPVASPLQSSIRITEAHLQVIVIGASTGGPQALYTILNTFPPDFPLPVICIQHINDGFLQGFVDWLASQSRVKMEIAKAGAVPLPGTIYFPQEGHHLKVDGRGRFVISPEPSFDGHRPSVTITMNSVVEYYGASACGVLLTGMGKDGAEGLLAVKNAGGITIAQDQATSVVFGMPKAAIDMGAACYILPLPEIGPMILNLVTRMFGEKVCHE